MTKSRQPDGPYDIRYWTAVGHSIPTPFGRYGQLLVFEYGIEVFLLDYVLSPDLPCSKLTRSDPASDRFGILAGTFRGFGDGNHRTILQQTAVRTQCDGWASLVTRAQIQASIVDQFQIGPAASCVTGAGKSAWRRRQDWTVFTGRPARSAISATLTRSAASSTPYRAGSS